MTVKNFTPAMVLAIPQVERERRKEPRLWRPGALFRPTDLALHTIETIEKVLMSTATAYFHQAD
jgi:hypothetical protein